MRIVALLLALVLGLAGCIGPASADESLARVQRAGQLRVGVDPSYPPFAADDHGALTGFDIDLAHALADRLGVRVVLVPIDVGSIFDGLLAGQFDVAISALPVYPELTQAIAFSEPYVNAGQVLIAAVTSGFQRPADVHGVIGAELGSTAEDAARRLAADRADVVVKPYETPAEVVDAVARGAVAAGVVDRVTALQAVHARPTLRLVGEPLTDEPYVVAIRRRDGQLVGAINRALQVLKADGSLAGIERRWLGP